MFGSLVLHFIDVCTAAAVSLHFPARTVVSATTGVSASVASTRRRRAAKVAPWLPRSKKKLGIEVGLVLRMTSSSISSSVAQHSSPPRFDCPLVSFAPRFVIQEVKRIFYPKRLHGSSHAPCGSVSFCVGFSELTSLYMFCLFTENKIKQKKATRRHPLRDCCCFWFVRWWSLYKDVRISRARAKFTLFAGSKRSLNTMRWRRLLSMTKARSSGVTNVLPAFSKIAKRNTVRLASNHQFFALTAAAHSRYNTTSICATNGRGGHEPRQQKTLQRPKRRGHTVEAQSDLRARIDRHRNEGQRIPFGDRQHYHTGI